MNDKKCPYDTTALTMSNGAPVVDNENSKTAGKRGPLLAEDLWLNEKLADLNREVIPERRMHAKGSGAFGTFTVTNDIPDIRVLISLMKSVNKLRCLRVLVP